MPALAASGVIRHARNATTAACSAVSAAARFASSSAATPLVAAMNASSVAVALASDTAGGLVVHCAHSAARAFWRVADEVDANPGT